MAMRESYGLGSALHDPKDANIDIVFVHGLGGDRALTWTTVPTDEGPVPTYWPKDLLPKDCPSARILSFGYNSRFADFYCGPRRKELPVETTIDDHSTSLLTSLVNFRDETKTSHERPVIFVCHSLGGLVVANALSRQLGSDEAGRALVAKTMGVVFLGTPFEGSEVAQWGHIGMALVKVFGATYNGKLKELEERSGKLSGINDAFYKYMKVRDLSGSPLRISCFFEEYPTFVKGTKVGLVVTRKSASLRGMDPIPIAATHRGMSKFAGDWVQGYKAVSGVLSQWIKKLNEPAVSRTQGGVYQERTVYNCEIRDNHGVIAGNIYGHTPNANHITGSIVYNYGGLPPPGPAGVYP